jgi:uncharacterized protein YecE (DUF72 family)
MGELRVGCSSWTSPAWSGRFYPDGISDGDRLAHYARFFDAVEVDSTYYASPNPRVVESWARKTPGTFRFTLKMPRELIDPKRPVEPESLAAFVETARRLGEKLGAVLLQFPPWFRPGSTVEGSGARYLAGVLAALPPSVRYSVELRNSAWFSGEIAAWLEPELRSRSIPLTWSSLTYLDVPPWRTAGWVYLRFIGDHVTVPAEQHGEIRVDRAGETRRWAERLRATEVESAFAFFNNHFAGYAPTSANQFRREMGLAEVPLPETGSTVAAARQSRLPSE